jgi:hypothetical protein
MVLSIRRSRSPFQIGICLALFALYLLSTIFFDAMATSSARELGPALGRVLYGGTAIAAGVTLAGVFTRSVPGIFVERIGLVSLAFWTLGSGVAVLANSGVRGAQFGGFMVAVTLMSITRAFQTTREARDVSVIESAKAKLEETP